MKNKLLVLSAFWIILFSPAYSQNQTELVGGRTTVDTRDSILDEWLTGRIFEVDTRDSLALALSSDSISENQPAGSEVGRFGVVGGGSATYSLVSGPGSSGNSNFTLSKTGVLKTAKSFDYEQTQEYSIRVNGSSSGKTSVNKVFTVKILDVDEIPLFIALSSRSISENQPAGSEVGRFSVAGGGSATYSLVSGSGSSGNSNFTLSPTGVLKTAKSFDYEQTQEYSIRVGAFSPGKVSTEEVFTVNLTDIFEPSQPQYTVDFNSSVELDMIWVEPGRFAMGPAGKGNPEHNVTLTQGFYLGKYEVTQEQYLALTNQNPSHYEGLNRPVENISWNGIQSFIQTLNERDSLKITPGWEYALPTEAEWEYACRAGTMTTYSWGDQNDPNHANSLASGIGETVNVGQYLPNDWGFFDMHGNVREWVADIYKDYPTTSQIDPIGGFAGDGRVTRGGSFADAVVARHRNSRNLRHSHRVIGFRLAFKKISLPPPALSFALSQNIVKENQPMGTEVGFFYQDLGGVPDAPFFAPSGLPEMQPQSHAGENQTGGNTMPDGPSILPHFPEIFTLAPGEGATHNHLFELRNGVLRTAAILDFETAPALSIRVKDNGFSKAEQVFAITVEDTEEPVQNEISLSNSSVMEKQPVGTEVGSFRINGKVDSGYMFSLVGGKGGADKEKFAVNGNVLSTASTLSASTDSSLAIRVQAMKVSFVNGLPEFDLLDQTFTIQVQEQPVANGLVLSRDSVWEGLPVGTTLTKIGSLENSAFVASSSAYSLAAGSGDDHNSWFTIEGNKVIAKQPLNSNDSPVLRFRVVENGSELSQSFRLKVQKSTISQPFRKAYENALETLKSLRNEVADLNTTHRQNEDDLITGREQNEALRKVLDTKETQLKKLKEDNLKLVGQEKELENEVVSLEAEIAAAVERISNINQKISDSSSQFSKQEQELTTIQEENETLGEISKVPHLKGWHYLPNQGWILVDPDYYPLFYQSDTNSWLSYEQGSSRPWNYYNHTTEQWESWE